VFFILSVFKVNLLIAYNIQKLAKTCKENTDVLSTFSGLYTQIGAPKPLLKKCTY